MRRLRSLLPLGAALALSACFSFGAKPPPTLMTITSASTIAAQTSRTSGSAKTMTVIVPTVPQELASLRVQVRTGATTVAYLKDAQWVEPPAILFARMLGETIGATTGRLVLDFKQVAFDPGTRLTGQLQAFGVSADSSEAVVIYDAALARGAGQVEVRRFEARVPLASIDAASVAPALNQAANQVAAEVANWIGA